MNKISRPVVVAMIGLVGSGKTTVARELGKWLRAELVDGDAIRLGLRKKRESFAAVRKIAQKQAQVALLSGKSVILSSDFVDLGKGRELERLARALRVPVFYVRLVCDPDVTIGRILANEQDPFFESAPSLWKGPNKSKVVKLREFWRRTPHHYGWSSTAGGKWRLKNLRAKRLFAIDTSDGKSWRKQVGEVAKMILAR